MKRFFLFVVTLVMCGCIHQQDLAKIKAPPAINPPKQVTSAEITAGTETRLRSYSPADVKSFVDTHSTSGIEAGAFDFTTWNGNTNAGTKDAIRDQLFVYDTDGDGDIDNIDGAVGGGDITAVGPAGTAAGDALTNGYATSGTTLFVFEGVTVDVNQVNFLMPSADPASIVDLTFPDQTGTFIVGPGAGMSDNVIPRVDGATSHLLQASGITIDDSNNLASVGTISSGAITSTGTSTFGDAASPDAADGATLGSATAEWSDLFLADGGVIYGQADQSNSITSSATDWNFALDVVITGSDLTLGAAGVKLTGDGDGAITLLGLGDGFDEDLNINLDDTENTAVISSTTGVTGVTFTSIGLTTGAASNLSAGTVTLGTVAGTITDGTASWNTSTQALAGFATVAATSGVTSPLYDVSGAAAITIGSADVTAVTITTDNTGDGTDLVLPAQSVNGSEMLNNTVTATQLSAVLTLADGDLVDMGGITHTGSADEGLVLPTWANVTPTSDKKFLAADGSSLKLYNGGWVTIGATAAPTDAQYVTLALDATLSAERVLTAGYALDFTDAGANGNLTVAVDTTEISADGTDTFSDGTQASVAWTVDTSLTADNVITFTNGLTTFNDAVTVTDTLTATNGIALGTSKSITGTTGLTVGAGTETVAINSSDWDIDATGVMTGIGNVTSDGVVTATGFTIGAAVITEAELEILDGATLTTTQINYLNAATGTTGTTSTNVVFSASPTLTGTVVATDIDGSGTFSANLFTPDAADGADIGSATLEFSDIYLADASIIYLGADQDVTLTHVADTGVDLNTSFGIADDKFVTFGGSLAASDWTLGYDETTSDALEFHTAGVGAALATTPMFLIQTDSGALGMTADQDIFSIYKGTTELFTVDEDGDVYFAGTMTGEPKTDPGIVFNEVTALDTDYWLADNADQEGDNDDLLSIGTGTTIGTGTIWTINPSGDTVSSGSTTTTAIVLEGGTYDTTIGPGTPTASVSYAWPLAAPASSGYALTSATNGTMSWSEITASPAGASGDVQYNNTTLGAEAAFNYNSTNNTLSITQAASNPTLQVGDGTYSWGHTPQVGIEGTLEVDGVAYVDNNIVATGAISGNNVNPDAADGATLGTTALEWSDGFFADGAVIYLGTDQDVLLTHVADTGINLTTTAITSGILNLGNDDDVNDDSIDLILHDSGVITLYDANDDTSVTLSVGDGTTVLSVAGGLSATGNVEGATLTEGGQAVYNASETPGGELGGTWASPTIDDTGIALTSITIGALLGVDSIDATGAVDMDYGSADITDHTFTTDGGATVIDGAAVTIGAAGVAITTDGDGAITFTGEGDGSDEAITLNLDDTADTVVVSSSTGVTSLNFSALNLTTTGNLQAGITTNTDANGMTQGEMTTAGVYGTMFWAGGAGTWNLPAVAAGMSLCVYSTTAAAVVINPDNADRIVLDGTALADGDSITSASAAGDFICMMYDSAAGWTTLGRSGTWTDTN